MVLCVLRAHSFNLKKEFVQIESGKRTLSPFKNFKKISFDNLFCFYKNLFRFFASIGHLLLPGGLVMVPSCS